MRLLIWLLVVVAVLAGIFFAVRKPFADYVRKRNQPQFRELEVDRGTIRLTVPATGRIEPRLRVQIGAFVSGPIIELEADFNDEVEEGQLLARIDPALYAAAVRRDEASLATSIADVQRVKATLQQAINDERRGLELYAEDPDFMSEAELDQLRFGRMSLEAQLQLATASVDRSRANLENSEANLQYTEIKAPQAGRLIDRKIDPGQTLAAQFQTPELFVLGVDMEKEMYVYASVDEADIGLIRRAREGQQPVDFRVDAYPDELFNGGIKEIRLSYTETQNVVTYPVVVTAANPDLKLLPGMTANLTFQVEEKPDVVRVPWAALRFFPQKPEWVRESDRGLLEGRKTQEEEKQDAADSNDEAPVDDLIDARASQRRHVWLKEGDLLRAVEVVLGISDYKYAELVSGELKPNDKVVTGLKK